ncbi:alpha/beta fold hydrolase [Cognatishimia sp. SS12]|uniref:alpha/beta hydrolase n=1 Tax=Cognatishimia sp. SS12 TaxID=2979465 RepID=UPI00232DE851|nr:alpha/beta fold hydrolase [Cognatishimia sp. SS12]MDC0739656.1 alpha/beta fold hydrolase [Cognatishimia sp. SS12]
MPRAIRDKKHLILGLALAVLSGCGAARPDLDVAPAVPSAQVQPIYVATGYKLLDSGQNFGRVRSGVLNYARVDVSVPPTHVPGNIEWPRGVPDAATDFVVTEAAPYDGLGAFARDIRADAAGEETFFFVHGYNNTLPEAMYRLAQIQTDFENDMPGVLFSWPSAGDPRGYVYDRDSVLFARDDMERTLEALTTQRGDKVFIVAHSMGAHLTMEVLRQAALQGNQRLLSRISGVILMSPDIDPDIFRRQAEAIGRLPQPFLIFVTQEDRALNLLGWLTGRKQRLGVINSPDSVAGLEVSVVDFTGLGDGEGLNHFVPVTSPEALQALRGLTARSGRTGGPRYSNFLVLKPPA